MSFSPITVLIPALKKTVAFQDDLVKKLNGISLVQRAINKAIELEVDKKDIHLLTDSEEIVGIIGKQWDSWEEIIEQPFDFDLFFKRPIGNSVCF